MRGLQEFIKYTMPSKSSGKKGNFFVLPFKYFFFIHDILQQYGSRNVGPDHRAINLISSIPFLLKIGCITWDEFEFRGKSEAAKSIIG